MFCVPVMVSLPFFNSYIYIFFSFEREILKLWGVIHQAFIFVGIFVLFGGGTGCGNCSYLSISIFNYFLIYLPFSCLRITKKIRISTFMLTVYFLLFCVRSITPESFFDGDCLSVLACNGADKWFTEASSNLGHVAPRSSSLILLTPLTVDFTIENLTKLQE